MPRIARFIRNNLEKNPPFFCPFIRSLFIRAVEVAAQVTATLAKKALAPLRRITNRKLFAYVVRVQPRYAIYCLRDTLECGHVQEHSLWNGLRDLLNAYTDNPIVRARRRRCHECAALLAERKPVQSALAARKAGAA